MEIVMCNGCGWEGLEEDLVTVMIPNEHDQQDKSLYEIQVCPVCRTEDYLSKEVQE